MRNLGFVALLALGMLTACATTTPYQPVRDGYGYQDQRIEGNRYRVTFAGSTAKPRQTVENYLLYHAAELKLARGNDYFIVTQSSTRGNGKPGSALSAGLGGVGFGLPCGPGVGRFWRGLGGGRGG